MKKRCNAVNKRNKQCEKNAIPFSQYCSFHIDQGLILSVCIGLGITIFTVWYQDRSPNLSANCQLINGIPTEIACSVKNSGRAEAKDVLVTFSSLLPAGTEVRAESGVIVQLKESNVLPDVKYPLLAELQKAFSIEISRISPKDTVRFNVRTIDENNRKIGEIIAPI